MASALARILRDPYIRRLIERDQLQSSLEKTRYKKDSYRWPVRVVCIFCGVRPVSESWRRTCNECSLREALYWGLVTSIVRQRRPERRDAYRWPDDV